jgi:hypothetical protein
MNGHGDMAMGGHGLLKVLLGPAIHALPIYALQVLQPFQGWLPAQRVAYSCIFTLAMDTPRHTPLGLDE